MKDPVDRGIRAIGRQNSYAPVWLQFGISHVVFLAGLGLIELYRPMSWNQFLVLAAVSQALVLLDNVISIKITKRIWRPVRVWERGAGDTASTIEAWRAAATLPLEYTRRTLRRAPIVTAYLPFMAFATWKLGLDLVYVPPRETHVLENLSDDEPAEYVVARDSPHEDAVVVPWAQEQATV